MRCASSSTSGMGDPGLLKHLDAGLQRQHARCDSLDDARRGPRRGLGEYAGRRPGREVRTGRPPGRVAGMVHAPHHLEPQRVLVGTSEPHGVHKGVSGPRES